jgi:hypothetical protein
MADGRDLGFDRLVRRELSRGTGAPVGVCPPVELVAAFFDRSLNPDEAVGIEEHLATCGRCQEIIGGLARTEPQVLYVHPKAEPRAWTWHLRWVAPLAAAATIALVVGTQSLRAPSSPAQARLKPESTIAARAADESRPEPDSSRDARLKQDLAAAPVGGAQTSPARTLEPSAAGAARPAESRQPARRDAGIDSARPAPPGVPRAEGQFALNKGEAQAAAVPRALKDAPPPPAAPPPPPAVSGGVAGGVVGGVVAGAEPALVPSQLRADKLARAQSAPGAADTLREAKAAAPKAGTESVVTEQAEAPRARPVAAAPAPAPQPPGQPMSLAPGTRSGWRLAGPGAVSRTDDGGSTWTGQPLPAAARLLAVSAVSSRVCWGVGRGGVIVRTTDGENWQVVTSPTDTDLVAVAAWSALHAVVTSTAGVSFETVDGGTQWLKR